MTDREKLCELVCESTNHDCGKHCNLSSASKCYSCTHVADHLLSNGVRLETKQATKQATSDKTSKWIRVEDGLPEHFCGVLVWTPQHKNEYCAYLNVRNEWRTFDETPAGIQITDPVTHWMPMPTPPKED